MRVWIVLAVIAGGGAIVAAQVGVRGMATSQGQIFEGSLAKRAKAAPLNAAQHALQSYMIERQVRLLEVAANEATKRSVILNNCTGLMTLLTKGQQQLEVHEVMQLDKYQPSPSPWDQVRSAPSMISALLKLTPEQTTKISTISKRYFEEEDKPWQDFFASPQYNAMPAAERAKATKSFAQKLKGSLTPAQLAQKSKERSDRQLSEIRVLLTPVQRSEWDAIKAKYDGDMARAISQTTPE